VTPGQLEPEGPAARPGEPDRGPGDPELVERLRAEIERDGPIPFARFMAVALYDRERGYYASPTARPTRAGDFLTAPELHPVFGRLVGRQLAEVWERLGRPDPFVVREHGAGAGTLGLAILDGLRVDRSGLADALRYQPVEVNPHRRAELHERFSAAGLADRLDEPTGPMVGAVVANELLDALPVHRVTVRAGRLRELLVTTTAGGFAEVDAPPTTPALAGRLADDGVALVEGQVAEICLELGPWVEAVAADLERGLALVIDYGHPAETLFGPRRRAGTLLAYARHRVHDDPFVEVGRQDLTAHVDLTALERAATRAGLDVLGRTSQAAFLAGLGLGDLLAAAGETPLDGPGAGVDGAAAHGAAAHGAGALDAYLALRSAVVRLIDPRAMGAFRVIALGRGLATAPPLRGFAFELPGRPADR
jgi:SAM-dependent MidA family methyltransferase